jgi:uncharacterized protein YxjI
MAIDVSAGSFVDFLRTSNQLMIRQKKIWVEIFTSFEMQSRYHLLTPEGVEMGTIGERGSGLWRLLSRIFLGTHRPFNIEIKDLAGKTIFGCHRLFFWFFSDIFIDSANGQRLGSAHRIFSFLSKRYILRDEGGRPFARIYAPFWRIWTFKIYEAEGDQELACITKKWGGLAREYFTEADTFMIDFGSKAWTYNQRATLLAAAISIDFDYFERTRRS